MKHYKDSTGKVFAFESDGSQDHLIEHDMEPISQSEALELASPALTAEAACSLIDESAGRARARYVADGAFIDQEYALVAADVKAWRDAGSPADSVPQTISAWADATGMTDDAAAANIEATSAQFSQLLAAIRTIRLTAKAMINEDSADIESIKTNAIAQLDAI